MRYVLLLVLFSITGCAMQQGDSDTTQVLSDPKSELQKARAQVRILERVVAQKPQARALGAATDGNACRAPDSCCCSADGRYGYCTTPQQCKEIGSPARCYTQVASGC
jgi:hypothetical protein